MTNVREDLKMVQSRIMSHGTGDATSANIHSNLFAAGAAVKKIGGSQPLDTSTLILEFPIKFRHCNKQINDVERSQGLEQS